MDQKEKRKGEELRVENTAAYNEMFRMNCETFDESLSGLWLPKQLTEKLSWTIIRLVKREKLSLTIMGRLTRALEVFILAF